MKHRLTITIILLGALLLTGCMSASFSGNYVVQSGDTLRGNLFVTSGSVMLEEGSKVTGTIILTSGALHIGPNAEVGGDVVLTSGALYMAEGAVVKGDVILSSEDIEIQQDPGSTIEGVITYNIVPFAVTFIAKGIFLFCVLPLVLLITLILLLGIWLGRSSKKRSQVVKAQATTPAPAMTEDAQSKLQQLKSLLDQGLISEADYEAKKADILAKM
jgi:cytoskeletal protein CcmA (bactofilin family)